MSASNGQTMRTRNISPELSEELIRIALSGHGKPRASKRDSLLATERVRLGMTQELTAKLIKMPLSTYADLEAKPFKTAIDGIENSQLVKLVQLGFFTKALADLKSKPAPSPFREMGARFEAECVRLCISDDAACDVGGISAEALLQIRLGSVAPDAALLSRLANFWPMFDVSWVVVGRFNPFCYDPRGGR